MPVLLALGSVTVRLIVMISTNQIPRMLIVIFTLVFAIPIAAQQEVPPIRNFLKVNDQFCTGGQPRLEHLQQLKDEGVKAIINLRPPGEHRAAEEEARAKELGLRYFNIPVVFGEPKDEQATEFLKIADDPANRPAFIHCASAIRVGAFWMIRRVLRDGWEVNKAAEEAKKIGLTENPHLNEFARSYIERHRKQPSSEQTQDTAVVDQFIAKQATEEAGEEYEDARKVLTGDLNRDGLPDLAVLYTIEGQNGTNNYVQYLAVFTRGKDKLVPIAHIVVGGKLNRDVELLSIKNKVIRCTTLSYRANDPASTPSRKGTARFVLVKRKLKEL
ncbi:MAG: fused DSP-PTPase phosphatase/NAD kinase-like protein [Pyrinomonadaceae bacterium]